MELTDMHPELYAEIQRLCERARGCGDTPEDVRAVIETLFTSAVDATTCRDCQGQVKHLHDLQPVT